MGAGCAIVWGIVVDPTHNSPSVELLPMARSPNALASTPTVERARGPNAPALAVTQLTPQQAMFAQWFAETRSLVTAYRAAYQPGPGISVQTIYRAACGLMEKPAIAARVTEVQDRLAASAVVRAVEVLQDLADIVNTNPNEIMRLVKNNCRHCRGVDHAKQWVDAAEFAKALDAWGKSKTAEQIAAPTASGGFGFDPRAEPVHGCPSCFGEGVERVVLSDTTKLSPKALKLIKGIKQDRFGVVTVELYDKQQARDMILKMLGAYKADGKGLPLTGQGALDGISNADLQDPRLAADAYIRMLAAPT